MSTTMADVLTLLRNRYAPPGFVLLEEVRNATGFSHGVTRSADALAMGLWPSRGLDLHGFEIKRSRGDWLRELKDPEKADEIATRCDFWWIVAADAEMVRRDELPKTWGLLVPRGPRLVAHVDAPRMEAKPLTRAFLAAILRRATDGVVPASSFEERLAEKMAEERKVVFESRLKQSNESAERVRAGVSNAMVSARERIMKAEVILGTQLEEWNLGSLAEAVAMVRRGGYGEHRAKLLELAKNADRIAEQIRNTVQP